MFLTKSSSYSQPSIAVDISNLTTKTLDTAESCLEFLILSFCSSFSINCRVSVGLLVQQCEYLKKIMANGLKGNFTPIQQWYRLLLYKIDLIEDLIDKEPPSAKLLISCLLSGITSKNSSIVSTSLETMWTFCLRLQGHENFIAEWIFEQSELMPKIFDIKDGGFFTKGFSVNFLSDIWMLFADYIEAREDIANSILGFLKRMTRDSNKNLQFLTFGRLYYLLVYFSEKKYSFAPVLYKTLIFCLIENFPDEFIREFMMSNMLLVLKEFLLIPVSVLVEPLIKQVHNCKDFRYNVQDFEFFSGIAQHEKLSAKDGIFIMDAMSKVFINDPLYCNAAKIPFMIITARFIEKESIQDFINKLVIILLRINFNNSYKSENLNKKIIRKSSLDLIEKIISLGNENLNLAIRDHFQNLYISKHKKSFNIHFDYIFQILGGPPYDLESEPISLEKSQIDIEKHFNINSWAIVPKGRAMSDIEKIRQKRQARDIYKNNLEIRSLSYLSKLRKKNKIKLGKLETGREYGLNKDYDDMMIENKEKDVGFGLVRICDEFPETQEMIEIILKNNSKVNKFLFTKYACSKNKKQLTPIPTFEKFQEESESLSEAGFCKMLSDNSISLIPTLPTSATKISPSSSNLLSAEDFKKIYTFFIAKLKLSSIPYEYFPELIFLSSSYIYSKPPFDPHKFNPVAHLQFFYAFLKKHSGIVPSQYFEYNDPGFGDLDVICALNKYLEKDPYMKLPNGYKKIVEPDVCIEYAVCVGNEGQKIVLELLDEVFYKSFGLHLLLPMAVKSMRCRAKGVLDTEKAQSLSVKYLNKTEAVPGFSKLTKNMKVRALAVEGVRNEDAVECAQILDDIIYTIEKKSSILISKLPKPSKLLSNRIKELQQFKIQELVSHENHRESKRLLRKKELQQKLSEMKAEKEHKAYLEIQAKQQESIRQKFKEQKQKERKDKEKFDIEEKILKYKLEKIEKEQILKRDLSEGRNDMKKSRKNHKQNSSVDYGFRSGGDVVKTNMKSDSLILGKNQFKKDMKK